MTRQDSITHRAGFTIVELLIVIVVIGILAAIIIATYNGIQNRARVASTTSDITNASKKSGLSKSSHGTFAQTADLLAGEYKVSFTPGLYKIFSVCSADTGEYVVAAELKSGDKYYSKNGTSTIQNNSINALSPCASLSITNANSSAANTIYLGLPATACAIENATCTFSGTQTVAYGSLATGKFIAKYDQTSPLGCNNPTFTDPASTFSKACYVLQY